MLRASIACVIATQGRETLLRAIRSVLSQDVRPDDHLIVVVDTHDRAALNWDTLSTVWIDVIKPHRDRLTMDLVYCPSDRATWSHEQARYGVSLVPEGHWISLLGDDDVYTPGAWAAMRARAEAGPPRPLLFRMDHNAAGIIWKEAGLVGGRWVGTVQEGMISEQNLIVPKLPGLMGQWDCTRYAGDFDWVRSTLELWAEQGIAPEWEETIIQFSRPAERGYSDDL